ncbi:MAG: hypothetical protein GY810_20115, partial [Aureispira sp.]|nr:hypothetical protein [Aureispira sp.]
MRYFISTKLFALLSILTFTTGMLSAQNPGGVGGSLEIWLKGGNGNLLNDQSGNSRNITNTGSMSPVANGLNFNTFISTNDLNRQARTNAKFRGQAIFAVARVTGGNNANDGLLGFDVDKGIREAGGNSYTHPGNADDFSNGGSMRLNGAAGNNHAGQWRVITAYRGAPTTIDTFFFVGGYFAGRRMNSDFAEIAVYGNTPSNANRNKIESYLALKYGITLGHNYTNATGAVIWDRTTNTGYNNDIAGIGKDANSGSGLNQPRSKSINGGTIVDIQYTGIANNQYLIWGRNTGATNTFTT